MIRICVLSLFVVFSVVQGLSQSDTLNRINSDGEKTGWWIIYLDNDLKQLKDSVGATHCRYTYYTGKFDHYNMGTIGSNKSPVQFPPSDTLSFENLKLLNEEYISNHKNGEARFVLTAINGILTEYKEYYSNGQLKTHFIYSKECGSPIRGCLKTFDKEGNLTYEGHNQVP